MSFVVVVLLLRLLRPPDILVVAPACFQRIDYWQTRRVGAEVMLEEALDTAPIDFVSVLRGAAMLEDVLANGTSDDKSVPPAMFKNLVRNGCV